MARYDMTYDRLASRAVENGVRDLVSLVQGLADEGVPLESIEEALLDDLENAGPVFGKFMRDISGAAASSVRDAFKQGAGLGAISGIDELNRALRAAGREDSLQRAVETGDPEAAQVLGDDFLEHVEHRWVAMLVNTCPVCLPLHGQERTLAEWRRMRLIPGDSIHPNCRCRLIPSSTVGARDELLAPLRRARAGEAGSKRTARLVSQADIDKALAARDRALQTPEGRRILRRLGNVGGS